MRIINTGDLRPARITTWDPLAGWLYRAGIYIVQEQEQLSSSSSGGFSHIFADKSLWLWEKRIIPSMIHRSPLLFPASEPLQSITIWLLDIIGLLYYEPVYMLYKSGVSLIFFFFFFHPAGSMRNVLTIEIFATRAITSWKSTFTISFTKGSCGTIKIKDVVFPLLFFWKRIQRMFWKKRSESLYLFRIPRWIKLLLVFHPCADSIWCVFLFSSWKLEE